MRIPLTVLLVGAAASLPGPARALNQDDRIATMGMLWRLREPICPRLSFDAKAFVKAMKLPSDPEALRVRRRAAFDGGYSVAGEWLDDGGTAKFCETIESYFDGKHDLYGNLKDVPEAPAPGLTIRP